MWILQDHTVNHTEFTLDLQWISEKNIKHTSIIKDVQRFCRKDQEESLSGTGTAPESATSTRAAWIRSTRPYASFDRKTRRTNMAFLSYFQAFIELSSLIGFCVVSAIGFVFLCQLQCSPSFEFAFLLLAKLAGLTLRSITAIYGSTWLRVRQSQQEDLTNQIGPASDSWSY